MFFYKMKKVLDQPVHFLDELLHLKENRLKLKSRKVLGSRFTKSEGLTLAGLDQVLNMHRLSVKPGYPSTSEIRFDSRQISVPSKRSRGRPRTECLQIKAEPDGKYIGEHTGRRRGRPCKKMNLYNNKSLQAQDPYEPEAHSKLHSHQLKYECHFCNSAFSQKGNLMTHIRTHTKERPFKCLFCDFSASQKINLQVHVRIHTKEKPFKCSVCDFSTAQKCNLVAHVTRMHSNVEVVKTLENYNRDCGNSDSQIKFYRCGTCMFSCRLKREMVEHVRLHHPCSTFEYQTIDVLK